MSTAASAEASQPSNDNAEGTASSKDALWMEEDEDKEPQCVVWAEGFQTPQLRLLCQPGGASPLFDR